MACLLASREAILKTLGWLRAWLRPPGRAQRARLQFQVRLLPWPAETAWLFFVAPISCTLQLRASLCLCICPADRLVSGSHDVQVELSPGAQRPSKRHGTVGLWEGLGLQESLTEALRRNASAFRRMQAVPPALDAERMQDPRRAQCVHRSGSYSVAFASYLAT